MKTRFIITILITSFLFGYGSKKNEKKISDIKPNSYQKHIDQKLLEDSLRRENETKLELEIKNLHEQGIFGKWECTFSGYESIILFRKDGDNFTSNVDFTKNNSPTKIEIINKKGEKYLVQNSTANEYYIINKDGNLEIWDKDDLLTTSRSIMPGQDSKPLPKFDINNVIGENIFTVKGNHSKSSPKTLDGTNNVFWIVYYKDLNVTFKVKKNTDRILKAKEGRIPNLK